MCCVFRMQILLLLITLGAAICSIGFCTDTSNHPFRDSERQALLNFKYGLTDPSNRLASWVEGGSCCDWYGVVCHNLTGHVRELHLRNPIPWVSDYEDDYDYEDAERYEDDYEDSERYQAYKRMVLGGKINTSLLGLKHLRYLDLSNNDFGGIQVPKFFGSMRSLRYLNLSSAGFGGEIPYQLGNLTKLRYLDMGNNHERSKLRYHDMGNNDCYVENLQWLSGLSMLRYLDLSYVNLQNASDRLQGAIALHFLEELHLSACQLHHIPILLQVNSSNLVILDLSYNHISSSSLCMTWGFGLDSLVFLDLGDNSFDGHIPSCLGNLTSLKYLDLHGCSLNSTLPSWLYKFRELEKLMLMENSFQGMMISEDIANLTNLNYFDLSDNDNLHELPTSMRNMCNLQLVNLSGLKLKQEASKALNAFVGCASNSLQHLSLSGCQLFGPLLDGLKQFQNLKELHLRENLIFGPIPESLGSLSSLIKLDLSSNQLNGSLPPSLVQLNHLKYLNLGWNSISGLLPSSIGSLTFLIKLYLHENQFSGNLSESIGQLIKLKHLDLSQNQFTGTLPRSIGQLIKLKHLDLSQNQFSGTLPENIGQLIKLKYLDLSENQFSGPLPEKIGQLIQLNHLDLSENQFSGPLPEKIGQLIQLNHLDLSENQFSGTLPTSLGQLIKLKYLSLYHNSLQCVLSDFFFVNLTRLHVLSASQNSITLKVSPNWIPPFQLEIMDLSSCNLGPEFPKWLSSQNHLYSLDISNASIEDTIPGWFWKMSSQFFYMNLSHNQLYGPVSDKITMDDDDLGIVDLSSNCFTGPLPHLSSGINQLDLSHNSFSGPLSRIFCDETNKKTELGFLHLGNNNLSGEIPNCWNNWPFIYSLDLQNNNLVGSFPSSMGSLIQLQYLHLRNNALSGVLPSSLQNCTNLVVLDLGENKLGGSVPRWIGQKLFNIRILSLRSNDFDGYISNEMCNLKSLIILDLAHNNLSGEIPKCLSNFTAMAKLSSFEFRFAQSTSDGGGRGVYVENEILVTKTLELEYMNNLHLMAAIDLSNNSLSGWIPEEITNLVHLISLNLSRNCLTGKIPENLGNMSSLESLDFSFNQISGEIPQSMAQMTFLEFLNLSYNNLRGRIPTSTQFQSFTISSFIGNNLCGPPISDSCNKTNGSISSQQIEDRNHHRFDEFYVSMSLGFVVGFGVVVGPLFYSRSWKFTYFLWLQSMWDTLWVRAVLLKRAGLGGQV